MKDNQDKETRLHETPQTPGEHKTAKPASAWKRLLAKKWAYPAIYMAAAAIIISLMWLYQGADGGKTPGKDLGLQTGKTGQETVQKNNDPDALPVNGTVEQMRWPVTDPSELNTAMSYYDNAAGPEEKAAAIIQYGDTSYPSTGIDLVREDNQTFDVLAAKSGKVTAVEQSPVVGNLVEITHADGLVTVYQSLDEVKVAKDAEVKAGDVIAKAGRNDMEKDVGVHLHFEVRDGENTVNPTSLLPK
ncbi:MAG: M23 family metallopeptidase [Gorillibacterium sp.]|nr:M23 family metallopeptidase [Gorillibacterium sp.]